MKQTKIIIIKAKDDNNLCKKANKFCEDKSIIDISLHRGMMSEDKLLIVYNE